MSISKTYPRFLLTTLLFLSFITSTLTAQDSVDIITMLNGDIKKGKVISVNSDAIKFTYVGESLEYEISKEEINQIQFSSGRVEVVNEPKQASSLIANNSSSGSTKNKVAVLPFSIVSNDDAIKPDVFGVQVQNDCANILREESAFAVTIQDPMTTNALLAKKGIDATAIATLLPTELASILGVEYVMYGATEVINEGTRTYGSDVVSYKDKEKEKDRKNTENKGVAIASSNSSTTISYDVKLDLKIFNDKGENIYAESRHPFGLGIDAYHSGLKYMIKRCPFGSKYKK
ncbi:hypothetical protein [Galbibacter orientalis]|uniref:hypothetical protein n=1 Tax=Galbibacter orientalis TaxID=453852 RepID=UPI00308026B7